MLLLVIEMFVLSDVPSALWGLWNSSVLLPPTPPLPDPTPVAVCVLELQSDSGLETMPLWKEQPVPPLPVLLVLLLPPPPLEQDESSLLGRFSGVLATESRWGVKENKQDFAINTKV